MPSEDLSNCLSKPTPGSSCEGDSMTMEEENETSSMQTVGVTSPCNMRTSEPSQESSDRLQDPSKSVAAQSSLWRKGSTKPVRIVAVGLNAHKAYRKAPFRYAIDNLVDGILVVIICLSRIRDEMGLDRPIDVNAFGGICEKKLQAAVKTQMTNVNHFLRVFRDELKQRKVQLSIAVSTGPKSYDILVEAAKELRPLWLVLDKSFSPHKKTIQKRLRCNLVLMKRRGTPLMLAPEDTFHNPVHDDPVQDKFRQDEPEAVVSRSSSSRSSSSSYSPGGSIRRLTSLLGSTRVFSGISYSGTGGDEEQVPKKTEPQGPTRNKTVVFVDADWAKVQQIAMRSSGSSRRTTMVDVEAQTDFSGPGTHKNVSFRTAPTAMPF